MSFDQVTSSNKSVKIGTAAIIVSLFLAAVDGTIVSTVLPYISNELGDPALYPWIMTAFLLPVALIAPLAGAISDRLGTSTTLKGFLLLFLLASVFAAISSSMFELIAARALQGIGAGGIIVLSYSLLAVLFNAEKRGKMQGILSGVWGLAAIVGPLLGSVLNNIFTWRSIFWFNIPISILALILLFITPTVKKDYDTEKIDWTTQALLVGFTCSLLLISQLESIKDILPQLLIILAVTSILLFIRIRKLPQKSPIPLLFFQKKMLFSVMCLILLSSAALYASVTLLPLALHQQKSSDLSSGLLIMLAALGWVVGSAICGNKLVSTGYRRMSINGMVMLACGSFLMVMAISYNIFALIAVALLLTGLGMGFVATSTLVLVQNSAPTEKIGKWTATVQFLRNLGASLGINTLATIQLYLKGIYSFQACFTILGLCMIIGLFFSLSLPSVYKNSLLN
ncbi:MAG: MFS transporter [Neisseria sp.]|uniref:MFS transporter n=1 Tax=Neisseria sp. TaxID=192066 RepID=UPI0026DB8062|nr:MFS transporter [Neisseria sp.]MDO4641054.1 MFS transporter [Neisseria sp.]